MRESLPHFIESKHTIYHETHLCRRDCGVHVVKHRPRPNVNSLHAKLLVFDRSGLYVGSMNYDQRSRHLNTENGLIIHSGDLAERTTRRFEHMTQPQNAYAVRLEEKVPGDAPEITWNTVESGQSATLHHEPARSSWQKFEVHFLELFPIDREL